jgi:hypothetical protein
MSNKEEITVEKYEFELNRSFELGVGKGWIQAGEYLDEVAMKLFKQEFYDDAVKMKKISNDIKEIGNKRADIARKK